MEKHACQRVPTGSVFKSQSLVPAFAITANVARLTDLEAGKHGAESNTERLLGPGMVATLLSTPAPPCSVKIIDAYTVTGANFAQLTQKSRVLGWSIFPVLRQVRRWRRAW